MSANAENKDNTENLETATAQDGLLGNIVQGVKKAFGAGASSGGEKSLAEHAPNCKAKTPESCPYVQKEAKKLAEKPENKGKSKEELLKMAVGVHETLKREGQEAAKKGGTPPAMSVEQFKQSNAEIGLSFEQAKKIIDMLPDEKKAEGQKILNEMEAEARRQSGATGAEENAEAKAEGAASAGTGSEGSADGGQNGGNADASAGNNANAGAAGGASAPSPDDEYEATINALKPKKKEDAIAREKKRYVSEAKSLRADLEAKGVPEHEIQKKEEKIFAEHQDRMKSIEDSFAGQSDGGDANADKGGENADTGSDAGADNNGGGEGDKGTDADGGADSTSSDGNADNAQNADGDGGTDNKGEGDAGATGGENADATASTGAESTTSNADATAGGEGGADNAAASAASATTGNEEHTSAGTENARKELTEEEKKKAAEQAFNAEVEKRTRTYTDAKGRTFIDGVYTDEKGRKTVDISHLGFFKGLAAAWREGLKGNRVEYDRDAYKERRDKERAEAVKRGEHLRKSPSDNAKGEGLFAAFGIDKSTLSEARRKDLESIAADYDNPATRDKARSRFAKALRDYASIDKMTGKETAKPAEEDADLPSHTNADDFKQQSVPTGAEGGADTGATATATGGEGGSSSATAGGGEGGAGTGSSGGEAKSDWKPEHQPKDDPVAEGTSPMEHAKVCKANPKSNCPFLKAHLSADALYALDKHYAKKNESGEGSAGGASASSATAGGGGEGGGSQGSTGGEAKADADTGTATASTTGGDNGGNADNGSDGGTSATTSTTQTGGGEGGADNGGNSDEGGSQGSDGDGGGDDDDALPLHTGETKTERKPKSNDEKLAENVKNLLGDLGVNAEIADVKHGLRATKIEFSVGVGDSKRVKQNVNEIVSQLHLPLGSISFAATGTKGNVTLTIPHGEQGTVSYGSMTESEKYQKARVPVVIGQDMDGNDIVDDLSDFHDIMISGEKGSGKSAAITSMVLGMAERMSPKELRMGFIDKKQLDGEMLSHLPHNIFKGHKGLSCAANAADAIKMLDWYAKEGEAKAKILRDAGVNDIKDYNKKHPDNPMPYDVLVFDEYSTLMGSASKAEKEEFNAKLRNLISLERARGIYVICATQGTRVKDGIDATAKGQCKKLLFKQSAKMGKEASDDEAESSMASSLTGKGDLMYNGKRGQGAFIHADEARKRIATLNQKASEGKGKWYTPPPPKKKAEPQKTAKPAPKKQTASTATPTKGGDNAAASATTATATKNEGAQGGGGEAQSAQTGGGDNGGSSSTASASAAPKSTKQPKTPKPKKASKADIAKKSAEVTGLFKTWNSLRNEWRSMQAKHKKLNVAAQKTMESGKNWKTIEKRIADAKEAWQQGKKELRAMYGETPATGEDSLSPSELVASIIAQTAGIRLLHRSN